MKKAHTSRKIILFFSFFVLFSLVCAGGAFAANRLLTHEAQQSTRISSLEKQVIFLEDKIDSLGNNPDEIFPENAGGGLIT